MGNVEKMRDLGLKKADAAADIELINTYTRRQVTPDEVYCFSVVLCDNEVDRDYEYFTDAALDKLAELFEGKTGILDHDRKAKNQIARVYRAEVVRTSEKNSRGKPLKQLVASAYMVRSEATEQYIEAIDGGLMKEVSVSCAISRSVCSICGGDYGCGHYSGREYGGEICVRGLSEPTDAFEFSFVAVPAQRGAGVVKAAKDVKGAFELLMTADISGMDDEAEALIRRLKERLIGDDERRKRAEILAENNKFLK